MFYLYLPRIYTFYHYPFFVCSTGEDCVRSRSSFSCADFFLFPLKCIDLSIKITLAGESSSVASSIRILMRLLITGIYAGRAFNSI